MGVEDEALAQKLEAETRPQKVVSLPRKTLCYYLGFVCVLSYGVQSSSSHLGQPPMRFQRNRIPLELEAQKMRNIQKCHKSGVCATKSLNHERSTTIHFSMPVCQNFRCKLFWVTLTSQRAVRGFFRQARSRRM